MNKLIAVFLIAVLATACRLEENPTTEKLGPLHIVTTTGIIEDAVENVVGNACEVTSLMGPGTDPHIYKPTPGDIELLDEADIIIANGLHLEGKMAEMLEKYKQEKPVLKMSDGLDDEDILSAADIQDAQDPHIWFDTKIWMKGLAYVTDELGKIDSSIDSTIHLNYEAYKAEIKKLDKWVQESLDSLENSSRVLVTSHDAFSYFGRKYKMKVKGIQGVSTLSEVGLKEVAEMVDFIIDRKIKAIFVETSTSDKTAQSIVEGCADKGYTVLLKGPLYSDALGEPDSDAGTYIGMIQANVRTIVEGLK